MKKILLFLLGLGLFCPMSYGQEKSFEQIAREMEENLQSIKDDAEEISKILREDGEYLFELENSGLRIHYVSFTEFSTQKENLDARMAQGEFHAVVVRYEENEIDAIAHSINKTYASYVDQSGNIILNSNYSVLDNASVLRYNCNPCHPCLPYYQSNCNEQCPGINEFRQYNKNRPFFQRIFGPGYNGQTLRSTFHDAPMARPYMFTHLWQRLDNPIRLGQGFIKAHVAPRVYAKNNCISVEDLKRLIARRRFITYVSVSFGVGGAAGGGGGGGGGGLTFGPSVPGVLPMPIW